MLPVSGPGKGFAHWPSAAHLPENMLLNDVRPCAARATPLAIPKMPKL
jgi:hypothetical protein